MSGCRSFVPPISRQVADSRGPLSLGVVHVWKGPFWNFWVVLDWRRKTTALGPTPRSWSSHFCGSGILKSDDLKCARGYFRVISQILRELRVRYCPLLFLLLQKPRHFSSSWQLQSGFSKTDHSGIFGTFGHGCHKLHIWQLHVFSGHTCQQKWLFATAFPDTVTRTMSPPVHAR